MNTKIYRAMRTNRQTQSFFESAACVSRNGKIVPCKPGLKSFYESVGMKGHGAYDFALWHGEHLYFPVDLDIRWWVDRIGHADERGLHLSVISDEKVVVEKNGLKVTDIRKREEGEEGTYIKFVFGHLLEIPYKDRDTVRFGQYLGRGDNTGFSTGDHLHLGMKECDKKGNGLNKNNGYYGNLDWGLLFDNRYVVDVDKEIVEMRLTLVELLKRYKKLLQIQVLKGVNKVGFTTLN